MKTMNGMTQEEYFRHYETLPKEEIEKLLDIADEVENIRAMKQTLSEVRASLPYEGVLDPVVELLQKLKHNTRSKDIKDAVGFIIDRVNEIANELYHDAEYARSEINEWGVGS